MLSETGKTAYDAELMNAEYLGVIKEFVQHKKVNNDHGEQGLKNQKIVNEIY